MTPPMTAAARSAAAGDRNVAEVVCAAPGAGEAKATQSAAKSG